MGFNLTSLLLPRIPIRILFLGFVLPTSYMFQFLILLPNFVKLSLFLDMGLHMIIWGLNHIWENYVFRFRSLIYQIVGSNFESVCTMYYLVSKILLDRHMRFQGTRILEVSSCSNKSAVQIKIQ